MVGLPVACNESHPREEDLFHFQNQSRVIQSESISAQPQYTALHSGDSQLSSLISVAVCEGGKENLPVLSRSVVMSET